MRYRLKGKPLYSGKSSRNSVRGSYYIRREYRQKLNGIAKALRCSLSNAIEELTARYGDELIATGLRRDPGTGTLVAVAKLDDTTIRAQEVTDD